MEFRLALSLSSDGLRPVERTLPLLPDELDRVHWVPPGPLSPLQSLSPLNDTAAAAYAPTRLHGHPERALNQTERAYTFGPLDRRS
jgi:hypothetical protein